MAINLFGVKETVSNKASRSEMSVEEVWREVAKKRSVENQTWSVKSPGPSSKVTAHFPSRHLNISVAGLSGSPQGLPWASGPPGYHPAPWGDEGGVAGMGKSDESARDET